MKCRHLSSLLSLCAFCMLLVCIPCQLLTCVTATCLIHFHFDQQAFLPMWTAFTNCLASIISLYLTDVHYIHIFIFHAVFCKHILFVFSLHNLKFKSNKKHWLSNTLDNNTISKKLATVVSGRKYAARPFVRQKQGSTLYFGTCV